MELEGAAFFDEEWDSLTKMFSTENIDFLVQLQDDNFFLNDHENEAPLSFWQAVEANKLINVTEGFFSANCSDAPMIINTNNLQYFSQESGNGDFLIDPNSENNQKNADNCNLDPVSEPGEVISLKRKLETVEEQQTFKNDSAQDPRKKPQASREVSTSVFRFQTFCNNNFLSGFLRVIFTGCRHRRTRGRQCQSRRETRRLVTTAMKEERRSMVGRIHRAQAVAALMMNLKLLRMLLADDILQRRREKINERLRILQNLVPNGTKVDISTMLEEAVHYVKFLQLQIKLLSSDDMWMYAPIAYNGMDIGHYQKMLQPTL
ncbi:uncharacterized protein LOC116013234 [Ipomoea triloba]|uniref:uncharacterized protein LOC116013234 n=1 Tax=Ipomoea triloba TaxID=35885 RepID=UPI00125E295B|nr:uncharacterized protein LOC116013234 [Ipomoea triloba]